MGTFRRRAHRQRRRGGMSTGTKGRKPQPTQVTPWATADAACGACCCRGSSRRAVATSAMPGRIPSEPGGVSQTLLLPDGNRGPRYLARCLSTCPALIGQFLLRRAPATEFACHASRRFATLGAQLRNFRVSSLFTPCWPWVWLYKSTTVSHTHPPHPKCVTKHTSHPPLHGPTPHMALMGHLVPFYPP